MSPTDVSQFVRLEQCERFLRFRLAERAGQDFMEEYDVVPQRITPLLSLSGRDVRGGRREQTSARRFRTVHYAAKYAAGRTTGPTTTPRSSTRPAACRPGEAVVLFQPRLEVELDGWLLRGDVDLLRLERRPDGTLHVLIADMKSHRRGQGRTPPPGRLLPPDAGAALRGRTASPTTPIQTGILFRPPADPTPEEEAEIEPLREAARTGLRPGRRPAGGRGRPGRLPPVGPRPRAGPDSTARRVARPRSRTCPTRLSFKCDGCLYNEFCMKWSAEHEDLSLLPYMTGTEKEALRRAGVTTIQALATLKEFAPDGAGKPGELVPAPGREAQVKQLAATWPVGPRLDELVHRARSFRRSRPQGRHAGPRLHPRQGQQLAAGVHARPEPEPRPDLPRRPARLPRRPGLPARGLVVACKDGSPVGTAGGRPADRRPARHGGEGAGTVRGLDPGTAAGRRRPGRAGAPPGEKKSAPIHLIFFDRHEQRLHAGGPGPQLPADPRGHAAAVRLPHPARRLRLARSPASSTRRSGRSRTSR